jgi:hypothetical protein
MGSMSRLGSSAAVLVLAIAFIAAGTSGSSAAGPEGTPAGPPSCSVLARTKIGAPRAVDFWLQCNVRLLSFSVTGLNRRIRSLTAAPVLFGASSRDGIACRVGKERRRKSRRTPWRVSGVLCDGSLAEFARIRLRFLIDRDACSPPRMRLGIALRGAEECTGYCPAGLFSFQTRSLADPGSLGCG